MEPTARVIRCGDFEVTGDGRAVAWEKASWIAMHSRGEVPNGYATRFKVMYSNTGLYILFDGGDKRLSATFAEDFANLWTEDVFEVFLWPDERDTVYFEYEISPLGRELPILVPNLGGRFLGWSPWNYEGERKVRKAVSVRGGEAEGGADITGWSAEVFIPWKLLEPLRNTPPRPGTQWRANFYRVDHDADKPAAWDWARVGPSFHDFRKFGSLVFE